MQGDKKGSFWRKIIYRNTECFTEVSALQYKKCTMKLAKVAQQNY